MDGPLVLGIMLEIISHFRNTDNALYIIDTGNSVGYFRRNYAPGYLSKSIAKHVYTSIHAYMLYTVACMHLASVPLISGKGYGCFARSLVPPERKCMRL